MKILNLPDELQTQVYLPETIDECRKISCTDCICLSHRLEGCPCQFNVYLATHTARKTAEPVMLKGCVNGTAKPSSNLSNYKTLAQRSRGSEGTAIINPIEIQVLLNEINQNIINLNKTQHEQQVPEHQKTDSSKIEFTCGKGDSMGHLLSEYEVVEKGQVGDLNTLLYMPNANDAEYGKDFYHRCSEMNRKLVRLLYDEVRDEHKCPLCKEVFLPK